MAAAEKILERMRNNPRDWRIEDLKTVAARHGFTWRQNGTSHVIFRAAAGKTLPVPAARPVSPAYVKLLVSMIDEAKEI